MADHLITGTLTYVIVTCGNLSCNQTWEQAHTPLDSPGWNVCPHCNWAAPTNVTREISAAAASPRTHPKEDS